MAASAPVRPIEPAPVLPPPHSVEAEQAVLGAVLNDPAAVHQLGELREGDFYRQDHRLVFRALTALAADDQPIDVITVGEWLEARELIERVGGRPYLARLHEATPSAANVAAYRDVVLERARRRYGLAALEDGRRMLTEAADKSAADVLADVQSRIASIGIAGGRSVTFGVIVSCALDAASAARNRRRAGGIVGVPTGLPGVDARTGGLHGPRLWIVAGRPSIGKTALALQAALHAASRGHRVGIISLEMGPDELGLRAIACTNNLNAAALAHGDAAEFERLRELTTSGRLDALRGAGLFVDFDAATIAAVLARITEWRRAERIDYAIVDHIGLVDAGGYATRVDQLGAISRSLKRLATRLGMPIMALSQLNRRVEQEGRRPRLSDLRDSGSLEQDADIVLMLHAVDESGSEIDLGLLKSRAGVRGWLPARYMFDGRTQRFRELARADHGGDDDA